MSGSFGSAWTYAYSSAATGCHSRKVISPSLPRLETQAEPLSCCPLHSRYGKALSALTWYICAVGWLYQLLQVLPPLTVITAPWSLPRTITLPLFGLTQTF